MKKQGYKNIITVFILLFSFAVSTSLAFDSREDRINKYHEDRPSRISKPGGGNNDENQTGGVPIGTAIPFLVGLVLIYGVKKAFDKRELN